MASLLRRTAAVWDLLQQPAATWSRRRAERRLWANVPTVGHLAELMAWFCQGELQEWPGHGGERSPETVEIGPSLAAANRRGFITIDSQPGCMDYDGEGWDQRAAAMGLATPKVVAQLRGLVAGTRLQLIVHEKPARWRAGYDATVLVSRQGEWEHTGYGVRLTARQLRFLFDGVPAHVVGELTTMQQVTILDPEWGEHDLLWRRLDEPDWDAPSPPPSSTEETAHVATKKTDEQIVREEYERLARMKVAEEIRQGVPQFQGGAPAVSLVELRRALLTRRINMSRERQDQALEQLAWQEGVHVRARSDQGSLTEADHAAAVRFGGDDRHTVAIETDYWSAPPPTPPPPPAASSGAGGGGSTASTSSGAIQSFADLQTARIDPFEYPADLPEHLGQVRRLLVARAAELEDEARRLAQEAAALYAYVNYMEGAELVAEVLETLQHAADTFSGQGAARWDVANQVAEAAEDVARAQRAAEARYGDNQVPRFDRAG